MAEAEHLEQEEHEGYRVGQRIKHPQFGEKRQAISVTLGAPVRLSVDMK